MKRKVYVPAGTKITYFCGSLLDKNPFKVGKMEYTGCGTLLSKTKNNAVVSLPDSHGIINVNPKDLRYDLHEIGFSGTKKGV